MRPVTRRDALRVAATGGTLLGLSSARGDAPARRLKLVVAGGHPGDPEYGCGGTVALCAAQGHEVVLLYLNEGVPAGKPVDGVRVAEANRACAILKARPLFAGHVDGDAVVDRAHYEAFWKLLASERPDVVFTHWPVDNHADHRATFMLVYDAWLRMKRSFAMYYYEVSDGEDTVQFAPTHFVDITRVEATKRKACLAHASQSPERFYELQSRVSRMRGTERGVVHAEGFIRHVQSPDVAFPLAP